MSQQYTDYGSYLMFCESLIVHLPAHPCISIQSSVPECQRPTLKARLDHTD